MVELELVADLPAATLSILKLYLLSQYEKKSIVATKLLVK